MAINDTSSYIDNTFPYRVTTDSDCVKVLLWCEKYIGQNEVDWMNIIHYKIKIGTSTGYSSTWYFKDEKHAVLFALVWK